MRDSDQNYMSGDGSSQERVSAAGCKLTTDVQLLPISHNGTVADCTTEVQLLILRNRYTC